jgi:hypothetical protein
MAKITLISSLKGRNRSVARNIWSRPEFQGSQVTDGRSMRECMGILMPIFASRNSKGDAEREPGTAIASGCGPITQ